MSKWSSVVKNMITGVREMTLHKHPVGKYTVPLRPFY